jgi:hypothetical protein
MLAGSNVGFLRVADCCSHPTTRWRNGTGLTLNGRAANLASLKQPNDPPAPISRRLVWGADLPSPRGCHLANRLWAGKPLLA